MNRHIWAKEKCSREPPSPPHPTHCRDGAFCASEKALFSQLEWWMCVRSENPQVGKSCIAKRSVQLPPVPYPSSYAFYDTRIPTHPYKHALPSTNSSTLTCAERRDTNTSKLVVARACALYFCFYFCYILPLLLCSASAPIVIGLFCVVLCFRLKRRSPCVFGLLFGM